MNPLIAHQYVLELFDGSGVSLGPGVADVDWSAAVRWSHFQGIRDGRLPAVSMTPPSQIDPIWFGPTGPPRIEGVRIVLEGDGGPVPVDLPLDYFADAAREVSATHVEAGRLEHGDRFTYTVSAFPGHPVTPATDRGDDLDVEPVAEPIVLAAAARDDLERRAAAVGDPDPADVPVYIAAEVLAQVREAVAAAGDVEIGGVLLGHLGRDRDDGGLFVEITAQVPARDAPRGATHITFTPETWSAARAALTLRGAGETLRGWWHSHPFWCRGCPEERRRRCALNRVFFSAQDCALHRTVFPRADQVALLISDREDRLVPSLFGWRHGRIAARGWHVLDGEPGAVPRAIVGGDEHAPEP